MVVILVLKEYQTGSTKMKAGSLALLLASEAGLTTEAQVSQQCPCHHSSSVWAGQCSWEEAGLFWAGLSTWHGSAQPWCYVCLVAALPQGSCAQIPEC